MAENYCPAYKLVTAWRTSCDRPTAPMFMEDSLDSVHNPCVHSYVKVLTLPSVKWSTLLKDIKPPAPIIHLKINYSSANYELIH